MILAATIGAAKAKVGDIEKEENLLKAFGTPVAELAIDELTKLEGAVEADHGKNTIVENGIFACDKYRLIATPSILVDKPVTLVGLGDTISSLSLVGSR